MGEATYNETQVEVETLESSIAMGELKLTKLVMCMFEHLHGLYVIFIYVI